MNNKNFKKASEQIDRQARYSVDDALAKVKELAYAKFDESVEASFRLGVDPRHADQVVRGTVVLPHGTGKTLRVLVVARGDKVQEAEAAGADMVGGEEMVEKIQGGWLDFDTLITTPDMMGQVGKLGRVLGPRGLMPNPKSGTVTMDVADAVKAAKAGKIEFRVDKTGNVHAPIGKVSFEKQQLVENFTILVDMIIKARPTATKGTYIRNISVSSTMGPGLKLDLNQFKS